MKKHHSFLCTALAVLVSIPMNHAVTVKAEDPSSLKESIVYEPETQTDEIEKSIDSSALLEGYIAEQFGEETGELYGMDTLPGTALPSYIRNVGASLTGTDAAVYKTLKGYIAEVAAGRRTSTAFTLTPAQAGIKKTEYTAKELGVDDVFSTEAFDKARELTSFNLSLVDDCLLLDCPYELYWFDKTYGVSSRGFSTGVNYNSSLGEYTLTVSGEMQISFTVAAEYAKDRYTVDTSTGALVTKSVTNAKNIVKKHAGERDYDKLVSYKKEICDLTSYNYEAAYGYADYGNPWQLIWIFDGDASTTVVCEGYSKGFQYLCDLTSFDTGITAYSVTGDMDGGGHMWNVVKMPDGQNYLVDVTNCDGDGIGADDLLFLKGYASGSVDTGYTFNTKYGSSVTYKYDSDTKNAFPKSDLVLSKTDYDPSVSMRIAMGLPAEITVGESVQAEITYTPEDTVYKDIAFSSSKTGVASIDEAGLVKGLKTGKTTITAKAKYGNTVKKDIRVLFTDVPSSGFYYCTPVYWAVDKGITAGFKDEDGLSRCFGPERNCTRAQMVTFLWRLAGKPNPKSTVSSFSDVTDSSLYYYKAVLWAAEKKITGGYDDGTFRPDDTCLREHAVTFLWRYAGKPAPKTSTNPFNDVYASDYYYRASLWANEKGISKGYSEGEYAGGFGPKLDCLREHIVTFMYRYAK